MSKTLPLRVCVLSLAAPQVARIQAHELVATLQEGSDLHSVYGERPDDWQPFAPGKKILDYLRGARFAPNSLTVLLDRCEAEDVAAHIDAIEELAEADLFFIDPLFFALEDRNGFRNRADELIRFREREFCVIIPERFSQEAREGLKKLRDGSLSLSKRLLKKRGQWLVENEERMQIYLERLWESLANGPSAERVHQFRQLMASVGLSVPQITSPPLLGSSD